MDSPLKIIRKWNKRFLRHIKNIILIILSFIITSYFYLGISQVKVANICMEKNNEVNIHIIHTSQYSAITSRNSKREMYPKAEIYTIYELTLGENKITLKDLQTAENYKNRLKRICGETVKSSIRSVKVNYIENLTSSQEIEEIFEKFLIEYNKSKTYYPTVSKQISSYYGKRVSPTAGASSFHKGIDISGKRGDNVFAYKYGVVVTSGYNTGGYGNMILLRHEDGTLTRYAHLSKILVKTGEMITGGTKIGEVGSTGVSTGNHLHFEIIINGRNVNPYKYIY